MISKYCKKCGHDNKYVGVLPKFCSGCGSSLSEVNTGPVRNVVSKSIASKKPSVVLGEDETDIEYVPDIGRLQYNVEVPQSRTIKMGDILKSSNRDAEEEI